MGFSSLLGSFAVQSLVPKLQLGNAIVLEAPASRELLRGFALPTGEAKALGTRAFPSWNEKPKTAYPLRLCDFA